MSKEQILVPIHFVKAIAESSDTHLMRQAQKLLDLHNYNKMVKAFYVEWQGLRKLDEESLKIVVMAIDKMANKKRSKE